jgi:predicted permease
MIQVLPILLIFLSGYIFKRFHKDSSDSLIDLVVYFVFPIFIFYKVHFLEFSNDVTVVVVFAFLAFLIGLLFSLLFIKLFKIDSFKGTMIVMSVVYGNTSFLGFAFVDSYYGAYALSLAIFYDQVNMLLLATLSSIICMYGVGKKELSIKKMFVQIITFPPTLAFILALISKLIVLPEILILFMQKVSLMLVPLIMFAVGMRFKLASIKGNEKEISIIIGVSMVLIPLSLYLGGLIFLENNISFKTAIMEAAMPPMVMATVIAIKAGLDEDLGMGALGVGMILSFVSIPIVFYLV